MNFNEDLRIVDDYSSDGTPTKNNSARSGNVEVVFRDIADRLIQEIRGADAVIGCVAWLTNSRILKALKRCKSVSLILQKEDFLRPDSTQYRKADLRRAYSSLPSRLLRWKCPEPLSSMSVNIDPGIEAVRAMGTLKKRNEIPPRMHNKFCVFASMERENLLTHPMEYDLKPKAVWTGSFNWTENAVRSFENAVIIRDEAIAGAYLDEWVNIAALSESLDWLHEYVEPEWRIGT